MEKGVSKLTTRNSEVLSDGSGDLDCRVKLNQICYKEGVEVVIFCKHFPQYYQLFS